MMSSSQRAGQYEDAKIDVRVVSLLERRERRARRSTCARRSSGTEYSGLHTRSTPSCAHRMTSEASVKVTQPVKSGLLLAPARLQIRRRHSSSRRRRLLGRPSPRMRMISGPASGTTGGLWSA